MFEVLDKKVQKLDGYFYENITNDVSDLLSHRTFLSLTSEIFNVIDALNNEIETEIKI